MAIIFGYVYEDYWEAKSAQLFKTRFQYNTTIFNWKSSRVWWAYGQKNDSYKIEDHDGIIFYFYVTNI